MNVTCACKQNKWKVYQMTNEKGIVYCEECHTKVHFELICITYSVQDRLNGLASVIPSRTNLADAYILGLVTK